MSWMDPETTYRNKRVKVARGLKLRCKGWRQEGLLRLLENSLECGIKPEKLIVYSGTAKVARNWDCYDKIVEVLKELEDDETLMIQSGKPVGVLKTNELMPRVVLASCMFTPKWDRPEIYQQLEKKGLTTFGSHLAVYWSGMGIQIQLEENYLMYKAVAEEHFGGTLEGKFFLTSGLGGTGNAQPLPVTLLGGVCLVVEVDRSRIKQTLQRGLVDVITEDLDEALVRAKDAVEKKKPLSIALLGHDSEIYQELVRRDVTPDIVTSQTPPFHGYIPAGITVEEAEAMMKENPEELMNRVNSSVAELVKAQLKLKLRGAVVFEYGTGMRGVAYRQGVKNAFDIDSYGLTIQDSLLNGSAAVRWWALSGDPADIAAIDEAVIKELKKGKLPEDKAVVNSIELIRELVPRRFPFEGLPGRQFGLAYGQQARVALLINKMVRDGSVKAPVAMMSGITDSTSSPYYLSEKMKDGSDVIADWCFIGAMLSAASGADLVATAGSGNGESLVTGFDIIADGAKETDKRLKLAFGTETALMVARYADAGYEESIRIAKESARGSLRLLY